MELVKLDDYQSWLLRAIDDQGRRVQVLIDPWLAGRFVVGAAWLFAREHREPVVELDSLGPIDRVIVSAHFSDHCDLATLARLPATLPILTTPTAARRMRRLGPRPITIARAGERHVLAPGVELRIAAPGKPYEHASLGLIVDEHASGQRLWFETHVADMATLDASAPVDVAVLPVESVRLLGRRLVAGPSEATSVLERLGARWILPTGVAPERSRGLLAKLLRVAGSAAELEAALRARESACTVVCLGAGERFEVPGGRTTKTFVDNLRTSS
ncbi:MBL fold metallo-hydrolase [Nannocystaceae bacterium ST9]